MKIKCTYFITVLFFSLQINSFAQKKLSIGFIVGSHFPSIKTEDSHFKPKSKLGLQAGINIEYNLFNSVYLCSGLQFLQKKAIMTTDVLPNSYSGISVEEKTTWNYNYFEIPLLLKYSYNVKKLIPYVLIGSNFGYIYSIETITKRNDYIIDKRKGYIITNAGILDLSLNMGSGIDIFINDRAMLRLSTLYLYSLSSINKYKDIKWRSFQFITGISYFF